MVKQKQPDCNDVLDRVDKKGVSPVNEPGKAQTLVDEG